MALASTDLIYVQQGANARKTTVDALQTYFETNLGTTEHNAADTTALVALTGISVGDRVFVADASGDASVGTGWAMYRADVANPTTIAAGTGYRKIAEQEGLDVSVADVASLRTLTGTAASANDLGTFTGTIITDNSTIKTALQELEVDAEANTTALGIAAAATDLGTFTGDIITDNSTVKVALQELETDLDAMQTLSGVADAAVNLGTFTGTTITDNVTIKAALQEVETALEAATHNAVTELAGDNPVVVGGTGQELSFDISSLPDA